MKHPVLTTVLVILLCFITGLFFVPKNNHNTVIKFSSWGSKSETEVVSSFIKKFEDNNPNITVEFHHIPQNYFQKIQLLFASGLEPDVVFINNQNIQMYINAGLLEDLTPIFPNAEKDFDDKALNCFRKNGKLYAIPRDISNLVIYYNKDIFKRQNIVMPAKIKDIYDLKKLAKKVTTKDNFGINFEENSLFWSYYLASNGGGILSDDTKKIIINTKESIEALNLYADMINKDHSMPSKADIGSMTTAQMFINGKLAMYLGGRWMTPKFRETIKFDWDVIEFPAPNKLYIDASGWAISKKSKNKKAAAELIKYLSSAKAGEEFAKNGLILPANKHSDFQTKNEKPRNYTAFILMLKNAKPTPINENYASINDIINEKVQTVFTGTKQIEEAFDEKTIKKLESLL